MKVYLYEISVYASDLDFTHGMGGTQTRLYIPNIGILGYRNDVEQLDPDKLSDKISVDFFSDNLETLANTRKRVDEHKASGSGNLREVDVPGQLIDRLVLAGKMANHAEAEFTKDASSFIRAFLL